MYALNQILQHRLEHSCCRTTDPEKADLFFAPMATMVYNQAGYRRLCQTHTASEVARQLVHMRTPTKACRHFFSVPHPTKFEACTGWYSHPKGNFKLAMRVSYLQDIAPSLARTLETEAAETEASRGAPFWLRLSRLLGIAPREDQRRSAARNRQVLQNVLSYTWRGTALPNASELQLISHIYPNLVSVPYPADLHWSHSLSLRNITPPWAVPRDMAARTILFVGGDAHGDSPVRLLLREQCQALPSCHVQAWLGAPSLLAKQRATFCLEPPGDSPDRKSISDSVTMGCVPVFFSAVTAALAPWFWHPEQLSTGAGSDTASVARGVPPTGFVLIDRASFLSGKVTLSSELARMPDDRVAALRKALMRVARAFQYATDPDEGDAVDVMLRGLHQKADESCARSHHAAESMRKHNLTVSP